MTAARERTHSSHWGTFRISGEPEALRVVAHPRDPSPSPYLSNIAAAARHRARVAQPMARRGWLERGPGPDPQRGREPFVPLDWDEALDLLAGELRRVYADHGAGAVFGGSYGWASAGRFHHAQSQVHRFLNGLGGYVGSVNSYSSGAAEVILPHVIGQGPDGVIGAQWSEIVEHCEVLVAFGGMATKNSLVSPGGVLEHVAPGALRAAAQRGMRLVLFGPIRTDFADDLAVEWLPLRPGTDVAAMLGIAHTLITEGLVDTAFLDRYTVGFEQLRDYVIGREDGLAKTPAWASEITEVPAAMLVELARTMARHRSLITVSHSIQRAQHGEQPVWMALALAALLGSLGKPGGGFAYALGATAGVGRPALAVPAPALSQGRNPVADRIPVARIADMLLCPEEPYDYDGERRRYPRIKLVYWAGGNPFHHHQDLSRLRSAFAQPDTVVVHDPVWSSTARHADLVLPCTLTIERNDLACSANEPTVVAMQAAIPPFAQARDDYAIFSGLAARLGTADAFTEGRTADEWVRHLYEQLRASLQAAGAEAPAFEEFWEQGELALPIRPPRVRAPFYADPMATPLRTPSGRIELHSETIASFGYADCPGHPAWFEPDEWLGGSGTSAHPIQLIANQPATRLHSQLDFGAASAASKIGGREPLRMHPADAAKRGIADADVVRVFSERGAFLAGAVLTDAVRPGVAQIATGAWYTPLDPLDDGSPCVHGNPNAVTRDIGTSRLAQGCSGQLTMVQIERADDAPMRDPYAPPASVPRETVVGYEQQEGRP